MTQLDPSGIENRRFERFDVDCRVKVVRKHFGSTTVHFGRASNISAGGIMLVVPVDLEGGEIIDLEFSIPHSSEIIQVRAVVRHRFGQYSYGIEFREMAEQTRQSVIRMCETLSVL
ncbi:MAG TPA: PilZ domain-containing protein [Terriglobales bacterium]|nr:PilZ domain-containing protein [Terriglobales bacterium]